MNRRDLLIGLALAAASSPLISRAAASAPTGAGSHGGTSPRAAADFVLPSATRRLVGVAADLFIPPTDTAGATGAGVVEFIEMMLGDWFSASERRTFLQGLAALDALSREKFGADFVSAGAGNQTALLTLLETRATRPGTQRLDPESFISRLKLLVINGYYTSEVGASVELDNTMVFPALKGCVDLEPGDRAQSMALPAPAIL